MKRRMKQLFAMMLSALLMVTAGMALPTVAAADEPTAATVYYIATDGSDENPGTFAEPFATLEKGMNTMNPGDTLYVRGGRYLVAGTRGGVTNKNGSEDNWFTVTNYPGEHAVFDGEWGVNGGGSSSIGLWFMNCSYWRVEGLEICNYLETGIFLNSLVHHMEFINLDIHDITDFSRPTTTFGRSGITSQGANDILVDGCEFSEIGYVRPAGDMHDHGIYVSGSGSNWIVRNSYFHDIPHGGSVHIYCPSGGDAKNNLIENNLDVRTYLGIVLGGPNCSENEVRNNTSYHNRFSNMFITEGAHNNNIHHNIFGPTLPSNPERKSSHINFPQLNCLYNQIDHNFYDACDDVNVKAISVIDNWVNGNTFRQRLLWDVWTAKRDESIVFEEVYDGSEEEIKGLGFEANGQTGKTAFTAPENGDFSLSAATDCTIENIGMAKTTWSKVEFKHDAPYENDSLQEAPDSSEAEKPSAGAASSAERSPLTVVLIALVLLLAVALAVVLLRGRKKKQSEE